MNFERIVMSTWVAYAHLFVTFLRAHLVMILPKCRIGLGNPIDNPMGSFANRIGVRS